MFSDNLQALRKRHGMSQEDLAAQIGISRQTLSKYEMGESLPDIEKAMALAEVFGISIDDLISFEPPCLGLPGIPRKGKHIFGIVKIGERGQIVLPPRARKVFSLREGDSLVVLGDENQGIALIREADLREVLRTAEGQDACPFDPA